jgi:hypothetical protein
VADAGEGAQNGAVRGDEEWVSVDLLDDADPVHPDGTVNHDRSPQPGPGSSSAARSRVGIIAGAVLAVLVALVAWPDTSAPSAADSPPESETATAPPPENPRLLAWPGRGPWAGEDDLVAEAAAVWRTNAAALELDPPGDEVHALWAGPVDERGVVVLQSVGPDGSVRVAQLNESRIPGSANPGPLRLTAVSALTLEPAFLALTYTGRLVSGEVLDEPGAFLVQVLPAPDLLEEGVVLQRVDGRSFTDIGMTADGLSRAWVHPPGRGSDGPVVAAVRTRGQYPGILASGQVTLDKLTPSAPPVQLVAPDWGRTRSDLPEDYLDGMAALSALDRTSGRVAVLGSTPTPDGRASLVEVRPSGPGTPVVVTVASGRDEVVSQPRPARLPSELAIGAARSSDGRTLVVAAGPPETSLVIVGADSDVVATGPRTTAVWLDDALDVSEVAAQGYRDDESWVGRSTLDVSDL